MSTNFLLYPGTSNNGQLVSPFSVLTTEMNSLANAGTALSSVGGTSGVFNTSNTGQAMVGNISLTLGAIGTALSAGAVLSGGFILSYDAGSTFENTVSGASQPRAPDFIIPLPATTITAGWKYSAVNVLLPAFPFKLFVQNNTGQTFASSGNILTIAPFAYQY